MLLVLTKLHSGFLGHSATLSICAWTVSSSKGRLRVPLACVQFANVQVDRWYSYQCKYTGNYKMLSGRHPELLFASDVDSPEAIPTSYLYRRLNKRPRPCTPRHGSWYLCFVVVLFLNLFWYFSKISWQPLITYYNVYYFLVKKWFTL